LKKENCVVGKLNMIADEKEKDTEGEEKERREESLASSYGKL